MHSWWKLLEVSAEIREFQDIASFSVIIMSHQTSIWTLLPSANNWRRCFKFYTKASDSKLQGTPSQRRVSEVITSKYLCH